MTRRSVLRAIGMGGATVLVGAAGLISCRAFDTGVMDAGAGAAYDPWKLWRTDPTPLGAIGAAILAASPHNQQGWEFRLTDATVDVFADPTREMPTTDPFRREHHVGLGCAIENLTLALGSRGYGPHVVLMPTDADPTHVASISLARGEAVQSPLHDAIGERHSNRGPYERVAVAEADLTSLSDLTTPSSDGDEGARVRWLSSAADKAEFGSIIVDATEAIIDDREQSEEFFIRFRDNPDDIERFRDGVSIDWQGLNALTLTLGKLVPAYSRSASDGFWLDQTRTVHLATAAAFGVINVDDALDPRQRLAGGRLLQRIHLGATARGLAMQHMNQITERIDREQQKGLPASFAPRLQQFATIGALPLVAFRVGFPVRASRPGPRRRVEDVIR